MIIQKSHVSLKRRVCAKPSSSKACFLTFLMLSSLFLAAVSSTDSNNLLVLMASRLDFPPVKGPLVFEANTFPQAHTDVLTLTVARSHTFVRGIFRKICKRSNSPHLPKSYGRKMTTCGPAYTHAHSTRDHAVHMKYALCCSSLVFGQLH